MAQVAIQITLDFMNIEVVSLETILGDNNIVQSLVDPYHETIFNIICGG